MVKLLIIDNSNNISDFKEIKSKISNELKHLHYNFSHLGTQYLCEAILLSYVNKKYINNLSKHVYPLLAKKYSTSPVNIKCNIFNATLNSYYECDEIVLQKYLNRKFISKPTTKDIILAVCDHIENS